MSLVERQDDSGVTILTLNRPEALNALSPQLFVELRAHIDKIAGQEDQVACVVLTGKGRSFSAGNDMKAIQAGDSAPSEHFQADTLLAIENLPQPVIAAVHGHCYTGALELVLACDLMIAAENTKFADTHAKWGMTPRWGMSQRLPRRVGMIKAKELMLTGLVVTGREAVTIGLANKCVADDDLLDEALAMAQAMVANSWFTLRSNKMLLNAGQNCSLAEGLEYERKNSPGRAPDVLDRLKGF